MLPNHAPLVIAEQFGTLASLYRRAHRSGARARAGHRPPTARALRRDLAGERRQFPATTCWSCRRYFAGAGRASATRAVPGAGLNVPIWLLGSSLFSAQLAAMLGLPFAFAAHFAPDCCCTRSTSTASRFTPVGARWLSRTP